MSSDSKPVIYSKKLTTQQNATLARFEVLTGQPPIAVQEFEAERLTAAELWREQVAWVEGVYADVTGANRENGKNCTLA